MKCTSCSRTTNSEYYCQNCVQDRIEQHRWNIELVDHQPSDHQPLEHLYGYQQHRLSQRRDRIYQLRSRIQIYKELIQAAQQTLDDRRQQLATRRNRLTDNRDMAIPETETERTKSEEAVQGELKKSRRVLVNALREVSGLRSAAAGRIFGLPWPSREDWSKYADEYISACVGHSVHVLSVLAFYLHEELPFSVIKRGAQLVIRPRWRRIADVHRKRGTEAALGVDRGARNRAQFVVGLGMLFYNVAYLCGRWGVRVELERVTDAVGNLRKLMEAVQRDLLVKTESELLDLYETVMEVVYMYEAPGGPSEDEEGGDVAGLRQDVLEVLGSMHLWSSARAQEEEAAAEEEEDESWAII